MICYVTIYEEETNKTLPRESESESESLYSILLQTHDTSAKTYLVAVAEATWDNV